MAKILQLRSGGDRNFSYYIVDESEGEAAIIDPGSPPDHELTVMREHGWNILFIIGTHDHFDHTGGIEAFRRATGAMVAMHELSRHHRDIELHDGDILTLGSSELHILHTPGHTEDSICILTGNDLITGDTLFVGKVGGTGFGEDALLEYESLHRKLMTLPPETRVWPGHDYGLKPSSTIGDELQMNPFILRESFDSFLDLKKNWAEYKRIHGIP